MKQVWLGRILAVACSVTSFCVRAEDFNGRIANHNDVIYAGFSVDQRSILRVWTDSYRNGSNFDPILAVWHDGNLLAQNDDDATVGPNQTRGDAGVANIPVGPGTYFFTLMAYDNFAFGPTLAAGFVHGREKPIPLSRWCQPFTGCNPGPNVSLHWSLVPIPEPGRGALTLAGLAVLGAAAWRRRPA